MSQTPSNNSSSMPIVWIILAVVGVCVVLCAGIFGVGWLAYEATRPGGARSVFPILDEDATKVQTSTEKEPATPPENRQIHEVVEAFLRDCAADDLDRAYALTTEGYRFRTPQELFHALIRANKELRDHSRRAFLRTERRGNVADCRVQVSGPNGEIIVNLQLHQEGDQWKINFIELPRTADKQ
ncbi:MAG: DUF4864 domain-containing protein [Gemmataceae bacterium]